MGSFSIWHWLIVLLVVVLLFGTKKLRSLGSDLGGAVKGFKEGVREEENKTSVEQKGQIIDAEVKTQAKEHVDFSFAELMAILVVTLVVVGPERLPKVARTAGQWAGKLQSYVNKFKQDLASHETVEEVRGLHAHIRNDVGAVRQAVGEAELSAEQMSLQARYQTPAEPPQAASDSITSDLSVKPAESKN